MKLLIVAMEFPPLIGGGGRYVENLVAGLTDVGIKVKLLTSGNKDSVIKQNRYFEIERSKLLLDLYEGHGDLLFGVDKIIQTINLYKPDIVQSNHSLETLIVAIANKNFSFPHVATHHKTPSIGVHRCSRNSHLSHVLNGKWSLFSFVNLFPSIFVAPSIAFKKCLLEFGVRAKKIHLIYPGVDRKIFRILEARKIAFERKKLGIRKTDLLVLIPTKIRNRKGIEFALKSLSKVYIPGRTIRIVITGLSEDTLSREYKKYLDGLAKPCYLLKSMYFSDQEMPSLYNAADITILPSENEGLGISLIESMACGTPVIGTDVSGIREIIQDGFNGKLVEYNNKNALAHAVLELVKNKSIAHQFVRNGFSRIENKFNLHKQAIAHLAVYQELIAKKLSR